ncbi:Na+/H+ antiporter subunit E [Paracoccus sp. Z118]|uniref:Na+/H+ antiporter subunit E n=1 Tax=Paracoccus sp. Z118 TaxID=2851017 RepID=UPI001C2C3703|nr:Na+/H+ antiporter subunit E [Paracoccus sp. Z118]MBV0890941.1 Na+/H+ antiporter subunit E [Paracoccus sp. Z118]
MTLFPHPLLTVIIAVLFLVLTGLSAGQFVLAIAVGIAGGFGYSRLTPDRVRLRRPDLIGLLFGRVVLDIIRSNYAVARLILSEGRDGRRRSGFVRIPLDLTEPNALAILAIIVTSTPGTAWVEHDPADNHLLLHVFDLLEDDDWIHIIKSRYEALLLEIFQ